MTITRLSLAAGLSLLSSAAFADFAACTYDVAKEKETCLRNVAQMQAGGSAVTDEWCHKNFKTDWEKCKETWSKP